MMAWKIYASGMLVLVVATLVGRVAIYFKKPGSTSSWDLWEAVFNVVLIPALFGFAWRRVFLMPVFWQIVAPLAWAAFVYSLFSPTHRKLAREKGMRVAVVASLASFALNLPGMLAITLYAYWRPEIWR